jgi:hypothetical protein
MDTQPPAPTVLFSKQCMSEPVQIPLLPDVIIRSLPLTPEEQETIALFKQAQETPQGTEDEILLIKLANLLQEPSSRRLHRLS